MDYKRIEIYVWWTCNQKCTYCIEFEHMEETWGKKLTKYDIIKLLIKYKKQWYNHVTYLWGEPFIQPVFKDALNLWKKLWYTILVTTNATTLHIEREAKKYLPYIDELILSVEALDKELQQKISRSKTYVIWEEVFANIEKYWSWRYLKANIVITKDNLSELINIVKYLKQKGVTNIAIVYPDIVIKYYTTKHIKQKIAPRYNECIQEIIKVYNYCIDNNIDIKVTDIPFCIFPIDRIDEYIKITDEYDYWTRLKITNKWEELDRKNLEKWDEIPRDRCQEKECSECIYIWKCWGPSVHYKKLFWLNEIKPIKNG